MGFYGDIDQVLRDVGTHELDYLSFGRGSEVTSHKMVNDLFTIWLDCISRADPLYGTAFAFSFSGEEDIYVRGEPFDFRRFRKIAVEQGCDYAVDAYLAGAPLETITQRRHVALFYTPASALPLAR